MSIKRNITLSIQSLSNVKVYAVTIVLTLGITLGALVATFSLNYHLLAEPLPYPDQDRLHIVKGKALVDKKLDINNAYPYPASIEAYKEADDNFDLKALVSFNRDVIRNFPDTPQVNTTYITPEYHQLLQAGMQMGRGFSAMEGLASHIPVAIISYSAWQQLFGFDPYVLDKTLRFGDVDFKIVGVTASDFVEPQLISPGRLTQVWLPWDYNLVPKNWLRTWTGFLKNQHLIGKLKTNVTFVGTSQELTSEFNKKYKEETIARPAHKNRTIELELVTFRDAIIGDTKTRAILLLIGSLALLLIATANITNLVLSRIANQQKNMVISVALGAQKFHLFRSVLIEIMILVFASAIFSLFVAAGCIYLLQIAATTHLPQLSTLRLSFPGLGFAFGCALLLAYLIASLVSHQIDYRKLNGILQASGKGAGIQVSANVRKLLIFSQALFIGILLTASLQVMQQAWVNINQSIGFGVDNIYQVYLNAGDQSHRSPEEQKNNLIAIRDKILLDPRIENASLANDAPIRSGTNPWYSYLSADPAFASQKQALCSLIDENYFDVLGLDIVAGRHLSANEFKSNTTSIVVNETFAKMLNADGDILGQRFYWLNSNKRHLAYEIVGIAKDLSLPGVREEPRMFIPQAAIEYPRLLLKFKNRQYFTNKELNELMSVINTQYKVAELISMKQARQQFLAQDTMSAIIAAALSLIALGLAAVGIYGVLSYSVYLRRFELGIRIAIGATSHNIYKQVLRDNLLPVTIGLGIAQIVILTFWVLTRKIESGFATNTISCIIATLLIFMLVAVISLVSTRSVIHKPALDILGRD